MIERTYWHSDAVDLGYPVKDWHEKRTEVPRGRANLVSSRLADGQHAPALDLDLPCELIPSSTEGHYHLLIDKPITWWRYRVLLRVLVFVGLIERKYYRHSVHRGMTMLRLPGIYKGVSYAEGPPEGGPELHI